MKFLCRWQMLGVHVSGKIHRDIGGHKSQRGRAAGRDIDADPTEALSKRGPGPEPAAVVQKQGRSQGEHEGAADVHVAVRQGGFEV